MGSVLTNACAPPMMHDFLQKLHVSPLSLVDTLTFNGHLTTVVQVFIPLSLMPAYFNLLHS